MVSEIVIDGSVYRWDDNEYNEPYRDPELLYELYHVEQYSSLHTIGDFFGVDGKTIKRWLEKGGYSTRSKSESENLNTPEELLDEQYLTEMYHEERMSLRGIASEIGVHHEHVRYYFEKYDIERRERLHARRHWHHPYVGSHPDAGHEKIVHVYDGERHNTELHRLLAVAKYGFDAVTEKEVHHRNHIPWDNRYDNIELLTPSEHGAYHGANKQEWGEAV